MPISFSAYVIGMLAIGPRPPWWRPLKRLRWARAAAAVLAACTWKVDLATIKKDPNSGAWPRLVADEKDVN